MGDGIRFVGVLQRGGEQHILLHGLFRVAGIDAGAAQEKQFLHLMAEAFADDVLLYLQVLVDEVGTIDTVCHDTAYEGGGKEHVFRLFFVEEAADGHGVQ